MTMIKVVATMTKVTLSIMTTMNIAIMTIMIVTTTTMMMTVTTMQINFNCCSFASYSLHCFALLSPSN